MIDEKLVNEQLELEQQSIDMGIVRYRRKREKERSLPWATAGVKSTQAGEATMPPGQQLIKQTVEPLAAAITAFLSNRKKKGVIATVKQLKLFDVDSLAFLTARFVVNGIMRRQQMTNVAYGLAGVLQDELEYREFRKQSPALFNTAIERAKRHKSERSRRVAIMGAKRLAGLEREIWSHEDKVKIGMTLIHLMIDSTSLVRIQKLSKGVKTLSYLTATDEALHWLEEAHARCELLTPMYLPMIAPPQPWSAPYGGGYYSDRLNLKFVRGRGGNYIDELAGVEMQPVYDAVNTIQETKWRINRPIFDVMREVWDEGGTLGGLPSREDEPMPALPHDMNTNEQAKKVWKAKAARVHERNDKTRGKRAMMSQKIWIAEQFLEAPTIYFPHVVDWRGRVYPVCHAMTPQSDDSGSALLQFAEGVPLGEHGATWLAIHLANCFGVDKVSFDERIQWVYENEELILDSAANPLGGQRFWVTEADKPYAALAACFEWAGYVLEGDAYISHLPIQLDGANNGIQHLSAMVRDEVGAKATCLIPADKPEDIYADIAKIAQGIVDKDAARGVPEATDIQPHINRSNCKRPVMTYAYGVTRRGARAQIMEQLRKDKVQLNDAFQASIYLGNVIMDVIGDHLVSAKAVMEWLKELARIAAQADLPIHWTAPDGFWIMQDYKVQLGKRVVTNLGGRRVKTLIRYEGTKLNRRKQTAGVAPNFVHSLDAAALVDCVNRCSDNGIKSFSMIHDSYGVHAAYGYELSKHLREAFVAMYSQPILQNLWDEIAEQLPDELRDKLPAVPAMGNLDLNMILESDYFFA